MRALVIAGALLFFAPVLTNAANGRDAATNTAVERGRAIYKYNCSTCHGSGPQMPGTDSLAVKYKGTNIPPVLEQRRDLTAAEIEYFTRNGVNMMPHFRKTEISDQQLKDMTVYLQKRKR